MHEITMNYDQNTPFMVMTQSIIIVTEMTDAQREIVELHILWTLQAQSNLPYSNASIDDLIRVLRRHPIKEAQKVILL